MGRVTCWLGLLLLTHTITAHAQQDRGAVTGTITYPSGALLVGVKVSLANLATNSEFESFTNSDGTYLLPNLPVGSYKLTIQKSGFKNYLRESVGLEVAQVARVDAQMQIGEITE